MQVAVLLVGMNKQFVAFFSSVVIVGLVDLVHQRTRWFTTVLSRNPSAPSRLLFLAVIGGGNLIAQKMRVRFACSAPRCRIQALAVDQGFGKRVVRLLNRRSRCC